MRDEGRQPNLTRINPDLQLVAQTEAHIESCARDHRYLLPVFFQTGKNKTRSPSKIARQVEIALAASVIDGCQRKLPDLVNQCAIRLNYPEEGRREIARKLRVKAAGPDMALEQCGKHGRTSPLS
jgi:hypothetical protein